MKFYIAINDNSENDESQTYHVVDTGSDRKKTNKRILREYLTKMGVHTSKHKHVLKALGFWDDCGK